MDSRPFEHVANQPVHLTPEAGAFFVFAISEQTSLLPSLHWLLVQVTSTNPAVRIKLGAIGVIFGGYSGTPMILCVSHFIFGLLGWLQEH